MYRQLSLLFAILAAVYASDELVILHSPDSVEFTVNGPIEQSSLKEIMSVALGFTGKQKDALLLDHCIAVSDPFSLPKALVVIIIDGIECMPLLLLNTTKITYPLEVDEIEEATWQAIRSRIEERSSDNTFARINLRDGVDALGQSAVGELKPTNVEKLKTLKSEVEEDHKFIEEIQLLHAIADQVNSKKLNDNSVSNSVHVYWLVVLIKPLLETYGNNSTEVKEACTLLNDAIQHVSKAFVNSYDGQVVVAAFTSDSSKLRNTRSVLYERQRRDTPEFSGRSKVYTENYPVIFNIILWLGVVFFFSLLAICIAIADMDPGRDSIIYRMTSNRMKKDN